MGVTFFIAILFDTIMIRILLVPALIVILKRNLNWWNPIKSLELAPSQENRLQITDNRIARKIITQDEINYRITKLKADHRDLYSMWRDWVLLSQQFRHMTPYQIEGLKQKYSESISYVQRLREAYDQELS